MGYKVAFMKPLILTTALVLSLATSTFANLFVNPGFEDPITQDGPPFVGYWEGFNSGGASHRSAKPPTFDQQYSQYVCGGFSGCFRIDGGK